MRINSFLHSFCGLRSGVCVRPFKVSVNVLKRSGMKNLRSHYAVCSVFWIHGRNHVSVRPLVECVCCEKLHSWCGSIGMCVHSWRPPACLIQIAVLTSVLNLKICGYLPLREQATCYPPPTERATKACHFFVLFCSSPFWITKIFYEEFKDENQAN